MTTTKKQPIAFSGEGSAISNYFSAAPVATPKVEFWGVFTKSKPDPVKRSVLFSLMHQANWTKPHSKFGKVPDMDRLSAFLQSDKSPISKNLKDMQPEEMEKLIKAFKGIVKSTWK